MAGGAPRTVSFTEEEMITLGEEMLQWLKENPGTLHLSEWYTINKRFTYNEWKSFIQKKEFIPYYEIALKIVGKLYLDKTSNVRDGISQRWQRVYFKDLKEEEDETKAYESSLRSQEAIATTQDQKDQLKSLITQLADAQKAFKSSNSD